MAVPQHINMHLPPDEFSNKSTNEDINVNENKNDISKKHASGINMAQQKIYKIHVCTQH